NASPYCLKLETWLRLAGLEYQVKVVSDPRKAPKGKLPYVRIEGEAIGDSEIVIRTLGERYGVTLDAGLDARGKGWARAITRLCDEHLYYLMLYFRWFDDQQALLGALAQCLDRPLAAQGVALAGAGLDVDQRAGGAG
ncbi:Tom37 metaxin N-terminal-like domain-containing protein, partial [Pseudomonas aeruginosa]|uniref:Tom37 metaxin N-terminal-like domain-containing protein n=1 Tax=Pseudomonas aeruginosa TaxID=287 RepID=UPI00217F1FC9